MRRVHGFCCMQPVIVCVTFPLSGQFAFSPAAFSKKHGREDAEGEGEDDTPHRSGARREKRQRAEPQAEEAPAPYVHRPIWASQKLLRNSRYTQAYGTCLCDNMFVVNVNVNVNELRLCFSNTTRNPEGILSHNNRNSTGVHIVAPTASGNASIAVIQPHVAAPQWPRTRTAVCRLPREHPFLAHLLCVRGPVALLVLQVLRRRHHGNLRLLQGRAPV
jgi:hypothetical protein